VNVKVALPVVMVGSGQKLMVKNSGLADLVTIEERMVVPSTKTDLRIHVSTLHVLG
jgi:hypothetical protein